MLICSHCKKEIEDDKSYLFQGMKICYSCFQEKHYKNHGNFQKWKNMKENMLRFILWISIDGDKTVFQEYDIHEYFHKNFHNNENKPFNFSNRNFFKLNEMIEVDVYNIQQQKKVKKLEGNKNDYLVSDGTNFYILNEQEVFEIQNL